MAKIELNNLSSGYNINTINVNFGKIETEFKDKVVYRNEASPMARDLDVNGFGVINLRNPVFNGDAVSYGFLLNSSAFTFTGLEYKGFWTPVTYYARNNYITVGGLVYIALEAHTSGVDFSTDLGLGKWSIFSSGGGDLVSTNNLSDLASASTARANLDVPSRSGNGATGEWSINAATATLAANATNATNAANASLVGGIAQPQLTKQTSATGSSVIPTGTTAQRDVSPDSGYFRFNTTTSSLEVYSGAGWDTYAAPSDASTTVKGIVELATTNEAQAGTDTTRAITPDNLSDTVLGMGQTNQELSASRALNTTYTNNTGRTIYVSVSAIGSSNADTYIQMLIGGSQRARSSVSYQDNGVFRYIYSNLSMPVLAGQTYRVDVVGGSATLTLWSEIRS